MTEQDSREGGDSIEELRRRYRAEQQKRLRPEGMAQYRDLSDEFEDLDRDPFVEPGFTREPVVEETTVVIVGGGFAGMLTAIHLGQARDHRRPDRREGRRLRRHLVLEPVPGLHVRRRVLRVPAAPRGDRASCPPSTTPAPPRSSSTAKLLARTFDLYPRALFQTDVTGAEWDEEARRWQVTTSRERPALGPLPRAGRGHPPQGQAAGDPRDRGVRGQGLPHQPVGLRLHRRGARPSRWTSWPTSGWASSAPGRPPCRWCPRSPGWPRSSTSSSAPRGRWASATSSPPTSSGSGASSPAGSTSGSSTSPRR